MPFIAKLTIGIIIATIAILIGYDIVVATNNVPNAIDTLSGRIRIWAFETPIVSWCWSGLAGHFFGFFKPHQFMPQTFGIILLVCLSLGVVLFGIYCKHNNIFIHPAWICPVAFLVWSILFAQ